MSPLDRTWFNTLVDDDTTGMTGSVWDKADVGQLMTEVDKTLVYCSLSAGAAQPIASGVHVAVNWDIEVLDPFNLHPTAAGSGITLPSALYVGAYFVTATLSFNAQAGGTRAAAIRMNGSQILTGTFTYAGTPNPTDVTSVTVQGIVYMDQPTVMFFEVVAYQTSGASINLARASLSMHRIA